MSWLGRFPIFATALLVLGMGVLGETALIGERWRAARVARKQLDRARRELRALGEIRPAPTEGMAALIQGDLVRLAEARAALRTELALPAGEPEKFLHAPVSANRPDAFFDLAVFVDAMRIRAQDAGVILRPDERFGFSRYAHEAPETAQLAAVFRERRIVQILLEALLEAQPHQLLSVQRSRPGGKSGVSATANRENGAGGAASGAESDYFNLDPGISVRVPGLVETTAIRLTFTGHTRTLRGLLTKLAGLELPAVVRAVEVTPADRPSLSLAPGRMAAAPVASPWSRFTVTIEFIALAPQPVEAS